MTVTATSTPNPNAMKFAVGKPVGGPKTYTDAPGDDAMIDAIFAVGSVVQVFKTSDFISVTKLPGVDWDSLIDDISSVIKRNLG